MWYLFLFLFLLYLFSIVWLGYCIPLLTLALAHSAIHLASTFFWLVFLMPYTLSGGSWSKAQRRPRKWNYRSTDRPIGRSFTYCTLVLTIVSVFVSLYKNFPCLDIIAVLPCRSTAIHPRVYTKILLYSFSAFSLSEHLASWKSWHLLTYTFSVISLECTSTHTQPSTAFFFFFGHPNVFWCTSLFIVSVPSLAEA